MRAVFPSVWNTAIITALQWQWVRQKVACPSVDHCFWKRNRVSAYLKWVQRMVAIRSTLVPAGFDHSPRCLRTLYPFGQPSAEPMQLFVWKPYYVFLSIRKIRSKSWDHRNDSLYDRTNDRDIGLCTIAQKAFIVIDRRESEGSSMILESFMNRFIKVSSNLETRRRVSCRFVHIELLNL